MTAALAQRTDAILEAVDQVLALAHRATLTHLLLVDEVDADAFEVVEDALDTARARVRPAIKARLDAILAGDGA